MHVWLRLGLVGSALTGLGVTGYCWYLQSPLATLAEIGQAMTVHDRGRFEKAVDSRQLIRHVVQDYADLQHGAKKMGVKVLGKPIRWWLRHELKQMVLQPVDPENPPPQFSHLGGYWQTDQEAHVRLILKEVKSGRHIPLALLLQKRNSRWQVTRVENLTELVQASQQ